MKFSTYKIPNCKIRGTARGLDNAEPDKIYVCYYTNGVLTLRLPKKPNERKSVEIKVL
ncbi:MAG: Hsp20 family protein [Methanobrevibacter sp.]|nr:Hsp20 family protein [Methanobrevibacter sp.]